MERLKKTIHLLGEKMSLLRRGSKIALVICAWLLVISMLLAFRL